MSEAPIIIGHEQVLRRLESAVTSNTLHHAYLFEGPTGLGKATVAEYLAMRLNCLGSNAPCGDCDSCHHIAQKTHPDIIYVEPDEDRASRSISVATIREIIRQTGYHHFSARHRVIIIDPAEAMVPAAANALLKTLEEPPKGTNFILIATHARSLLPTIVSRCQRVRFSPLDNRALSNWIRQQGVDDPLPFVRRAQGCPGRALTLVNGGLELRNEVRSTLLSLVNNDLGSIYAWSTSLCNGDRQNWTPKAEVYLEVAEDLLRDVVIRGSGSTLEPINADIPEVITTWTQALWPTGVERCTEIVGATRTNLLANVTGKTAMDAFVVQLSRELGYRP